jgi:hypothetical protein
MPPCGLTCELVVAVVLPAIGNQYDETGEWASIPDLRGVEGHKT